MKINKTHVTHWIPLIIWLLFIFTLSSIHGSSFRLPSFITIIQINIEELLSYTQATFHIGEYSLLVILIFRVLMLKLNDSYKFIYLISFNISILYAISDEVHQYFVPGRFATLADLIFDTIGIILGLTCICIYSLMIKK